MILRQRSASSVMRASALLVTLAACRTQSRDAAASVPAASGSAAAPAAATGPRAQPEPPAAPASLTGASSPASLPGTRVFDPPPQPPAELGELYVDRGACPGECCTYRKWSATAAVDVLESPASARVVARLAAGEKFQAETGEVHVRPHPARVRLSTTLFEGGAGHEGKLRSVTVKPGDVVWVLAALGEGVSNVWASGHVYTADTTFEWGEPCATSDDEACWAVADPRVDEPQPWWVRVRTKSGVVGWVDNTDRVFTGYGCD